MTAGRTGSNLVSFVSCERILRWWQSALRFFRRCFLLRHWGACGVKFPERSGFNSTCTPGGRSPLRRRATFGTCPGLGGSTSFGSRPPFCCGAALHCRPLFPGRARGRRTFLTFRHMLLPPVRTSSVSIKLYFSLCQPQRRTQRKHHRFRLCFLLIVRLGGEPMAKRVRPC